jgi:type IV pilus assembly protein PilB
MLTTFQQKILEALKAKGLISGENLTALTSLTKDNLTSTLDDLILQNKFVTEEDFFNVKSEVFHMPYVELAGVTIAPEIISIIPEEAAETYSMICFGKNDNVLQVALADPENYKALEAANFLVEGTPYKIEYYLTSKASFEQAFRKYQELPKEIAKVLEIAKDKMIIIPKEEGKLSELPETPEAIKAAPVSKIVSVIIRHAVEEEASDIHIEPTDKDCRIRYRVDGILQIALMLPLNLHPALVARIKVLANLKLDETRRPQDGRIRIKIDEKEIDLRISTLPLLNNEKVVMRILDTSSSLLTLEDLGFNERSIKIVRYAISKPHGIFLITGPTGSGKTTTLYAGLSILNQEKVNIVTVEDPIEYFIKGVNQSQINPEVGLTFASGLRSILRQDPNIIMVGEIRDTETAELAIHAGLTGHLVLTTLHTKDAAGALPRLIDMKVEPFLIASTLNAVSAQRLVRKICAYCKEDLTLNKDLEESIRKELSLIPRPYLKELTNLNLSSPEPLRFFRGKGCPRCASTGYKGRTVIAEFLVNTPELQQIINQRCPRKDLEREFRRQGMITMKEDGLLRALQGLTSIEEVLRVIQE